MQFKKVILPDPFGVVTNYISVSSDERGLRISDGTHEVIVDTIRVELSSGNWAKPFALVGKNFRWLITHEQLKGLFTQVISCTNRDSVVP